MKKNYLIFMFAVVLTCFGFSSNSHAAVTLDVRANGVPGSLNVPLGTSVNITWSATNASSCTNNFNSSTSISGNYTYVATTTQTFTITCQEKVTAPVIPAGYCSGTVSGSKTCDGSPNGPFEGESCSQFTTKDSCISTGCHRWLTHGCTWHES